MPGSSRKSRSCRTATVNWINSAGGARNLGSNWSTGNVPGPGDAAVINLAGNVTIIHSTGTDTIQSLQSNQAIVLSGGTLNVTGTLDDSISFTLTGGTLGNATVQADTTIQGSGSTLNGITLAGTLSDNVFGGALTITNGLTLNSGLAEITNVGNLNFSGSCRPWGEAARYCSRAETITTSG